MRTYTQTKNHPQKKAFSSLARANTTPSGLIHQTDPMPTLQRAIRNQAGERFPQANDEEREAGSATLASTGWGHDFSKIPLYPKARPTIQPKLAVSTPGDPYEREADRVADAVVAGDSFHISHGSPGVQPKLYRMVMRPEDLVDSMLPPGEGLEAGPSESSAAEEVQRSPAGEPGLVTRQFEQTLQQAVHGGGEGLPAPTRSFMESRFGRDFSTVRVHNDAQADGLAQAVNARAFTLDQDIFFARSQYQPESLAGQRLLAHELTHVVQQSEGRLARQIQRQTSCSSYPSYNTAVNLRTYNCAGLALRTYQYTAPPSAVYDAINANFTNPQTPASGTCDPGRVKFWLWEYDLHFEDDQGNVIASAQPDFHIVAGRVDANGNDPSDVYSKNGRRPVYGPNNGPSFRPPARERATLNAPSETPLNTPQGRPLIKVRSSMTEHISCADCHP